MLKCDFNKLQSNFIESYFGMGVLLLGERRELSLLPNFQKRGARQDLNF